VALRGIRADYEYDSETSHTGDQRRAPKILDLHCVFTGKFNVQSQLSVSAFWFDFSAVELIVIEEMKIEN
jgi:hypothetical protein